ncbi:MAG TPA: ATP-binding cassette domain-containing protein [Verrucomicrobiae bacterium]|nr:ATP-binding cassette domain-containing protein [Verrucomicrobiae bacterium]
MKIAFEVADVYKHFGDVKALDGVSLRAEQGKVFGLLGPNGAGKTTLVRMLSTLMNPDKGTLHVMGVDVVKQPHRVREMIGLAGQYAAVDEFLTGRENLYMVGRLYHMGKKEAYARADEILENLGLTDAANRPARTYSGGMRRRLDLGGSLVARPKILFLDEPTTGLDPRTRLDLWDTIRELVQDGTSILLTTQYLEEADELADQIAVIDHGKVIVEGTSDQLKSQMGGDVIEFEVKPSQVEKAAQAVRMFGTKDPKIEGATITLPVRDGRKKLVEVVRTLDAAKIAPESIALHRPSLDDVFLAVTGKDAKNLPKDAKNLSKASNPAPKPPIPASIRPSSPTVTTVTPGKPERIATRNGSALASGARLRTDSKKKGGKK